MCQKEMPKYQCSKQVWALKIKDLTISESGSGFLTPDDSGFSAVYVSPEYMRRHNPQVGGYYVVYKGGYESFSPSDVFEDGYFLIRK